MRGVRDDTFTYAPRVAVCPQERVDTCVRSVTVFEGALVVLRVLYALQKSGIISKKGVDGVRVK